MSPEAVLVVCAGNLCRSPFAAGLLAQRLAAEGMQAEVFSRGLIATPGQTPPRTAIEVAAGFGVDMRGHRAQRLLPLDARRAGLVLVMEARQKRELARLGAGEKTALISEPLDGADIPDPIGKPREVYEAVYGRLAECVDAWIEELAATF